MTSDIRLRDTDDGFTLIELLVVVLIVAVLVAIAIPTFLGFRERAQDRAAQAEVRNVLLAEKAYWTENGSYTASQSALETYEATLFLHATDPAVAVVVTLEQDSTSGEDVLCLTRTSGSGTIYGLWEGEDTGTFYGTASVIGNKCRKNNPPSGFSSGGW